MSGSISIPRSSDADQTTCSDTLAVPDAVPTLCPTCSYTLAVPFFDGGMQPLAALGWPMSTAEAQAMPRYPHDIVQCPACSHVWNRSFRYDAVPYKSNLNHMFNRGGIWRGHLAHTRDLLLSNLPAAPTVIDIGCGEGHFVRGLAEAHDGRGRFLGFDPNSKAEPGGCVEFHARIFDPLIDMAQFNPDAVVIRHLLEHLSDGALLLEQLAWGAAQLSKPCLLFAEVPRIDRVLETNRLVDFFYEHVNHFTSRSFRALMQRAGEVVEIEHGYDGEVIYGLVRLGLPPEVLQRARSAANFFSKATQSRDTIRAQLDALAMSGANVVIWGGTGKGAAFIHQFAADAERFPTVVDSDSLKVGTFVPGTGQCIQFRDVLKGKQIDVLIIPMQWRAKDILAEMARESIRAEQILIEHQGRLIDYERDEHPYR